jgi:hypothetical protein
MATQKTTQGNGGAKAGEKEKTPRKEWSDQEKRANFKAAASARTSRVIKAVRALRGITRASRYAWTADEVGKILGAIANEVQAVERQFRNPTVTKGAEVFTL